MKEILIALLLLVAGFVLLIKGADFFVDGSSSVAKRLRVPSMIIGLTIVAMGTSLPECAVSVTASLSNNNALAVSNVVGSNIFNLMVVCGVCTLFVPLAVSVDTLKKEFPFSIICAVLLVIFGKLGMILGRADGIIFLVLFAAYLGWMIKSALSARNSALSKEAEEADEQIKILPVWQCLIYIIGGAVAIKFGGDFVVDVVADFVDAVGRAVQQADAHGDGAHVELLLLDHLVGLVDLHDIQHGFSLRLVRFVASITCVTHVCRGSDAVHLGKDLLALAADAHANLFAEFVEIVHDLAEFLVGVGIIHNHHHVEETVDDGLGNVKHVDLMFGKVCADACDDADSILTDDGDDCLVHGTP